MEVQMLGLCEFVGHAVVSLAVSWNTPPLDYLSSMCEGRDPLYCIFDDTTTIIKYVMVNCITRWAYLRSSSSV